MRRPSTDSEAKARPLPSLLPPLHPSIALIVHYSIAAPSILWVHDRFFAPSSSSSGTDVATTAGGRHQDAVSKFLLWYALALFVTRYLSSARCRVRRHAVPYELTWLCNSTLVVGGASLGGLDGVPPFGGRWLFRSRPLVAASFCVAVSVDQMLWYVDLAGWAIAGAFPVGVMRYLTWEQTPWIDRLTCTHHLWTMPLMLLGMGDPLDRDSFLLSAYVVSVHVLLSRWLTPRRIEAVVGADGESGKSLKESRYLNVNLSHELWRDIKFSALQISIDNPPCCIYLFRLLWRWQLFNGLVFIALLRPLSNLIATLNDKS